MLDSKQEGVQLSQIDILPVVKQYLSASLFKNAQLYETANTHAKYMEFNYNPIANTQNNQIDYQDKTLQFLRLGTNPGKEIHIQILRLVQFNNVLICLTLDQLVPISKNKYAFVAIVFVSQVQAKKWSEQNFYLTILKVKNPYRSFHKAYSSLPFVLTTPNSIIIKRKYQFENKNPENIKNQANIKFREKKYELALIKYEIGIGLMKDFQKLRERAVMYANSSQCLYEMRLYKAALIYAEISISLDKKYIKGLFRKLNCLLQLNEILQVPKILSAISEIGSQKDVEQANSKYARYMTNSIGIINWIQLFKGSMGNFGEYTNQKFSVQKKNNKKILKTKTKVKKYELLLIHKPLIYKQSEQQNFGQEYTKLTEQIENYSRYQDLFYQEFQTLPYQYHLQGLPLIFDKHHSSEIMEINQIHSKCLRCLELQKCFKYSTEIKTESMGIWPKFYLFEHKCLANCTYFHIKGGLIVFALQDIQIDQTLSIDFLNWQTRNRKNLMKQKLGVQCSCTFCDLDWENCNEYTDDLFYLIQKNQYQALSSDKLTLYYLWQAIQLEESQQLQKMKTYLKVLQRYPVWQCIINCIKYLKNRPKNEIFDYIKTTVKKIFQKYFKLDHNMAVQLLKYIL